MGNQNLKMRDVNDNPDRLSAEKTITSDMFETAQSPDEINHQKTTSTLTELDLVYNDFIGEKKGNITDDYSLLSPPIGKGSFGEVRRAIQKKTNITRAVKIIYKDSTDPEERKNLINEINILKKLDHPNIMKIFEFYQDSSHLYLVTEYFNGGELFDRISKDKSFSERQAAITMKQILSAVSYCHAHNIVHRDIKPENILYESKQSDTLIKIIDFGTSRFYDPTVRMDQRFGTPYYIAPEVLKKDYTEKCDVWSCGVILYLLLSGIPPFNGDTEEEILKRVSTGKYDFKAPEWDLVSDQAMDLIKRMLAFNPQERCSAEEALKDPWFKLILGEETLDKPLAISALTNLKHFRLERKLQKAVWMMMVECLASKEEKAELLKTFQALDLNGDGQLSREELLNGYKNIMDSKDPEADVDEILKCVDNNHSGTIDYTEFVIATVNRRKMLNKEKLETLFKLFDKDGDGFLSPNELEQAFNPGKLRPVEQKVWCELLSEFDINGDGKISLSEFRDMMSKIESL